MSPKYAFDGLYPFPKHHPYDTYSMVDFDEVDVGQWPEFKNVGGVRSERREHVYVGSWHLLPSGSWRCPLHSSVLVCTSSRSGKGHQLDVLSHDL